VAVSLGPVLTNVSRISKFINDCERHQFRTALVVTGWGLDNGWTDAARRLLLLAIPNLVVRTVSGDPSYRGWGALWRPDPDVTVAELAPWVRLNPTGWYAIGNEPCVAWEHPDISSRNDEYTIWVYRYWLDATLRRLRREFPHAKFIAPSPRIGVPGWQRWLEIPKDVIERYDAASVHVYGWHRLFGDGKGELAAALRVYPALFPNQPVFATEVGINDPATSHATKLQLYRHFAATAPRNWRAIYAYHYDEGGAFHKEYAFLP
jgi:hypothetical protein